VSKARVLNKALPAVPVASTQSTTKSAEHSTQPKPKPSYATAAAAAVTTEPSSSDPQNWTTIGPKGPIKTPKAHGLKKPVENRVILTQENPLPRGPIPGFSPLSIRNAFNKAFYNKGIKDPVVSTISRSWTGNIVVTTTPLFNADFLLDKQSIWDSIIPFKKALKQVEWYKVTIHGIPIQDFDNEQGMALIIEEIKTFNKGLTPIGTPYWLTSALNRKNQLAGSVAVSFPTEEQANRAIKNRLYIAGISVLVRKHVSTASTTQCTKCGSFGHLHSLCKKTLSKCLLCSDNHATEQHYCPVCKKKGKKCLHLVPKCINY